MGKELGGGLNRARVGEYFGDLLRQVLHLLNVSSDNARPQLVFFLGDIEAEQIQADKLRDVSFRAANADFRAGVGIQDFVGLAGNRRPDDVHEGQRRRAFDLGFAQRGQRVGSFPRLGNNNRERICESTRGSL